MDEVHRIALEFIANALSGESVMWIERLFFPRERRNAFLSLKKWAKVLFLACAFSWMASPRQCEAANFSFSDRAVWLAALGGNVSWQEDFSAFANVSFSRAPADFGGKFSLFSTGQAGLSQQITSSSSTTVNGSLHARFFVNADEPTFVTMHFGRSVFAWGADFGGIGIDGRSEGAVVEILFETPATPPTVVAISNGFLGVIASRVNPISSVVFRNRLAVPGDVGEPFGMDNVAGAMVAEPGTRISLAVASILFAGTCHCRRRSSLPNGRSIGAD